MEELRDEAKWVFYAIKHSVQIQITIRIQLKTFKPVTELIALYGNEVWAPLLQNDWEKWDENTTEILLAEFGCKEKTQILHELDQYSLLLRIKKRSRRF